MERETSLSAEVRETDLWEADLSEIAREIRRRTPARLLAGRCGTSYRTGTLMELREAHAAARDAVGSELDLARDLGESFIARWNLFEARTQAATKQEFLLRPDLGRKLDAHARTEILRRCPAGKDLQVIVGDGLSVTAVRTQAVPLLDALSEDARARGWNLGQFFVIRHCRVGILNEIGDLLAPKMAVLLIGERPGLATAESLSAYMAFKPKSGHTDADRNLISNIHARGVGTRDAARRILNLAAQMIALQTSGYMLREDAAITSDPLLRVNPNL
jgi:ethanolamine ammonia-lyase small subunit